MLLGLEVLEVARRADLAQLDIGGLVRPDRNVVRRRVGDAASKLRSSSSSRFSAASPSCDRALEGSDLIHQPLGFRLVLARLGLADLFRGGVAAGLRLLQFLNRRAALLVQAQNLI